MPAESGQAGGQKRSQKGGQERSQKGGQERSQKGVYVYGIVPADVEMADDVQGVGDPPGELRLVRHEDIAALISDVDTSRPLGRPEDLTAHQELLDLTVAEAPVLPLRFGAVLTDEEAVAGELLGPHHDEFAAALRELDGRAQYVVKGRYVEETVLREVLRDNKQASQLREQIRDAGDEDATRPLRIQLGEIINDAVSGKRETDTRHACEVLEPHSEALNVREPSHEEDAVNIALLVEISRQEDLEQALNELASKWDGRVRLRLLGPMAPYDFVGTLAPAG